MTVKEAKVAMRLRVPIQTRGATASRLYGSVKYQRIARLSLCYDKYGKPYWTVDLVGEMNSKSNEVLKNSLLVCGPEDIELADDAPETLRRQVYCEEAKNDETA